MKARPVFLCMFLLMLYISPVIFIASDRGLPILDTQNMTKEFSSSEIQYDTSPQSITSFAETLPNDVLYYPDAITNGEIVFASAGLADDQIGDYQDTWVLADYFGDGNGPDDYYVTLNFTAPHANIEAFNISLLMGVSNIQYSYLWNYLTSEWDLIGTSTDAPPQQWVNATGCNAHVGPDLNIQYMSNGTDAVGYYDIIYYAQCFNFQYMTHPSSLVPFYASASNGTPTPVGDYSATQVKDGSSMYNLDASSPYDASIILEFVLPSYVEYFNLHFYGYTFVLDSSATTKELLVYNGTSWVYFGNISENSFGWTNISIDSDYIISQTVYMKAHVADDSLPTLLIDYVEILSNDINSYAESFADISDWTFTGASLTTDGDIANHTYDGTWRQLNSDSVSFASMEGLYVEYRLRCSTNIGTGSARLFGFVEDASGGGYAFYDSVAWSTEWVTYKYLISNLGVYNEGPLESLRFSGNIPAGNWVQIEYLRIGPSNEMGYQHDGSTVTGISSDDGTITTNSERLTLSADSDGSSFIMVADITTTASAIRTSYYPFFGISISSSLANWTLEQYNGSIYTTLQDSTQISSGIYRFNMASSATYVYLWRINVTSYGDLIVNWAKAYSLANYTISFTTPSITRYAYVSNSILYTIQDGGTIRFQHDPDISFSTGIGSIYNISINDSTGLYRKIWIDGGTTIEVNEETTGALLQSVTITDFQIDTDSSCAISSIKFLTVSPQWFIISTVELIFNVPYWHIVSDIDLIFGTAIDTYFLHMILLILGIIIVPSSTTYMAYSLREHTMSKDKAMYTLFIFFIGWALILGGVLG